MISILSVFILGNTPLGTWEKEEERGPGTGKGKPHTKNVRPDQ